MPRSGCRLLAVLSLTSILYGCSGHAPLPPRAAALNQLGLEAFGRGDLATAEARLSLALEFHPRFVEALVNLGLVELARGNHERAGVLIGRARRLNGDLPHPHHGLGVLAHRRQRLAEAAEHYREALRVDPAFVPSRANLGRLLFDAGAYDEAREQFARLIEAAPGDGRGHAGMVESLVQLGRRADAANALDRALHEAGATAPVRLLAARAALAEGHVDEARAALQRLADEPSDAPASVLGWLSLATLAAGDAREAQARAERALELDRHDPVATYAMARALEAQGDPAAGAWQRRVDEERRPVVDARRR